MKHSMTFHRCSIGDMSGEHAGHGNLSMLLARSKNVLFSSGCMGFGVV